MQFSKPDVDLAFMLVYIGCKIGEKVFSNFTHFLGVLSKYSDNFL